MEELNLTNFPVIVIDGVDYSGKTTLTSCLIEHGFTRIKSPSNDKEGKYVIKRAFVDFASKDETYSLFRKNNFHLSANMLSQTDSPIVLDRFFLSTYAYHSVFLKKDLKSDLLEDINSGKLLLPDKYVILDVPVSERINRAFKRDYNQLSNQKIESIYFHEFVREKFIELAKYVPNSVVLSGTNSVDSLVNLLLEN